MNNSLIESDRIKGWRLWSDLHHPPDCEVGVIKELLDSPLKEISVLEVGCGDGRVLKRLAPLCKTAVGVDTNKEMIAFLQDEATREIEQLMESGRNSHSLISYAEMSATELEFEDETFDLIIFPWSLHQVKDKVRALSHAKRVLNAGGHLIVFGLAAGGQYEVAVSSLGLDPGPQVDPAIAYEQPLLDVFSKIKSQKAIGPDDKKFGFLFQDKSSALAAWQWALKNWHDHDYSQSDIDRLSQLLDEMQLFMHIHGMVYCCQKS